MDSPRVTPAGTRRQQPPTGTGGPFRARRDRRNPTVAYSADRTTGDIESQARGASGRVRSGVRLAASWAPRIGWFQRPPASHDGGLRRRAVNEAEGISDETEGVANNVTVVT